MTASNRVFDSSANSVHSHSRLPLLTFPSMTNLLYEPDSLPCSTHIVSMRSSTNMHMFPVSSGPGHLFFLPLSINTNILLARQLAVYAEDRTYGTFSYRTDQQGNEWAFLPQAYRTGSHRSSSNFVCVVIGRRSS